MGFLIVLACGIVGFLVGGMTGGDDNAALGFFAGLAIGFLQLRLRGLAARIDDLRSELHARRPTIEGDARGEGIVAAPVETAAAAAATPPMPDGATLPGNEAEPPAIESPAIELPEMAPPQPEFPHEPAPGRAATAFDWLRRWFTEGNVPVKVGMLILFAGVAALLRYASDQGWLRLPIELRLAGVALAAIGALAFGWRERLRRRSFGLTLQGGANGVLLLTVFAAFRLYGLLPAGAAFALLLVLVAGAGVLAVLQDALALAVLGLLAGFVAPILLSTGAGNHVVLFSYYALLNLAILAVAWVRPWRVLNLLGFFFTFAIGTAWGVLRYDPAQFASTEPFLVFHFLLYLAIPILFALRSAPMRAGAIDGTLVFGMPLIAFALQAGLLDGERLPLALSALALAVTYLVLAWALLRRVRLLGESFAVLAVGFATLAVPLAFSARVSGCVFALEGAALIWLGLRQGRRLPQISGLLLQLAAAGAMSIAFIGFDASAPIFANARFIAAALIAGAAMTSAWLYLRAQRHAALSGVLYAWGLLWWLGALLAEIDRAVPPELEAAATLAAIALTTWLAAEAQRHWRRAALAWTAAAGLWAGLPLAIAIATHGQPLAGWPLAAHVAYAIAGARSLVCLRESSALAPAHLGWLWTWTVVFALALDAVAQSLGLGDGWRLAATSVPLIAMHALALRAPNLLAWPVAERVADHRRVLLGSQAVVLAMAFVGGLFSAGGSQPLPFVPLLNPLELSAIGTLVVTALWLRSEHAGTFARQRPLLLAAGAFAFVTAATLRAAHHLAGAPWDIEGVLSSSVSQTSLAVVWSVLGVAGWVIGSRRGQRGLWLAGAALMAIVLLKLLLIDRQHLGNLFGIASFIAYGLLCTLIGYLAPAPPRSATAQSAA